MPQPVDIKNGTRKQAQSQEKALGLWAKRRKLVGFDWAGVDCVTLKSALSVCGSIGAALTFSPASGGHGVCCTIWYNNQKDKEYASDPEELHELLDGIIDEYGSKAEDVRETMRMGHDARQGAD